MKKKRRFINYGTMFLLSVIVGIVAYKVSYGYFINHYSYVLEAYSEENYDYLVDIAEKTITEGKGINTEKIPEDVEDYSININHINNSIIFNYSLKWNESLLFSNSPEMTITLSKDYKILSKESIHETKETYVMLCKRHMLIWSGLIGVIVAIVFFVLYAMQRSLREERYRKKQNKT